MVKTKRTQWMPDHGLWKKDWFAFAGQAWEAILWEDRCFPPGFGLELQGVAVRRDDLGLLACRLTRRCLLRFWTRWNGPLGCRNWNI